jgi:hypothetical protein
MVALGAGVFVAGKYQGYMEHAKVTRKSFCDPPPPLALLSPTRIHLCTRTHRPRTLARVRAPAYPTPDNIFLLTCAPDQDPEMCDKLQLFKFL